MQDICPKCNNTGIDDEHFCACGLGSELSTEQYYDQVAENKVIES